MTPAERKKLQRKRDRALGWVEVTVKVSASQVEAVRAFAASLPDPVPPKDPAQLDLIERIEAELSDQDDQEAEREAANIEAGEAQMDADLLAWAKGR
jgi:hypothetical protein